MLHRRCLAEIGHHWAVAHAGEERKVYPPFTEALFTFPVTAELKPTTPKTTDRPLTAAQRTRIRTRLVGDLQGAHDLEAQLRLAIADGIESRRGSSNDEIDDPEGSNTAFEGAQSRAMLDQTSRHAHEISIALSRIDAGTYGTCTSCGGPIGMGRLEARPSTEHCIACAA